MKPERNSSFELLRIILIVMILVEHGNMWFVRASTASPVEHWAKCIVETVCIGSVNAFVLISGWFGIRGNMKKIGDLAFMLLFCTVPLLVLALACGWLPIAKVASLNGIYEYVLGGNPYWFVADYIGLLIIAPVLNIGIIGLGKKSFVTILAASYILIAIYDFVFRTPVLGAEGGYSLLWFAFLYLLGRYMRAYSMERIEKHCLVFLLLAAAIQSVLFANGLIGTRYTNPFILLESVCLILIFKGWNFHSRFINYVATGCLIAYLLHMQPILIPYIGRFLTREYSSLGYWLYMAEVIGLSCGVFILAVFLNKVQSTLYRGLTKCWSR